MDISELAVEAKLPHRKRESGRQLNRFNVRTKGLAPRSNIGENSGGVMLYRASQAPHVDRSMAWLHFGRSFSFSMIARLWKKGAAGLEQPLTLLDAVRQVGDEAANSVHGEVTSLHAKLTKEDGKISLRMVDEYESEIKLPYQLANMPLTSEQIIGLFRDADPTATKYGCEIEFQSFFHTDLDEVAQRLGVK